MANTLYKAYTSRIKSPLVSAGIVGVLSYLGGRLGSNQLLNAGMALAQPYLNSLSPEARAEVEDKIANFMANGGSHKIGLATGVLGTLLTAGVAYDPAKGSLGGLLDRNAPASQLGRHQRVSNRAMAYRGFYKKSSFQSSSMDEHESIVSDIDWYKPINAQRVNNFFNGDPHLVQEPYIRNLGCSIVNNAAISQHTNQPTLGGVFDSAISKLDKKLTLGGLADVATKTVIANAGARLFTGALNTMCDLSPSTQANLISAGTWAGAIKAILD